jgi:hypothetical protein
MCSSSMRQSLPPAPPTHAVLSKLPFTEVAPKIEGRETYQKEMDDPDEEEHAGISKGMRVVVGKDGQGLGCVAGFRSPVTI